MGLGAKPDRWSRWLLERRDGGSESQRAVALADLEDEVRSRGRSARARFVRTGAEDLAAIADASVDVVTTRSVLIYVSDKASAFGAFARVLRPGGRVSLFEPINSLMFPEPDDRVWGYEVASAVDLAMRVKQRFAGSAREREAMTGFDDRDLAERPPRRSDS